MVVNATTPRAEPRAYAIRLEIMRYGTRTACPCSVWNRPAIELVALATRSIMLASRSPLRPRTWPHASAAQAWMVRVAGGIRCIVAPSLKLSQLNSPATVVVDATIVRTFHSLLANRQISAHRLSRRTHDNAAPGSHARVSQHLFRARACVFANDVASIADTSKRIEQER